MTAPLPDDRSNGSEPSPATNRRRWLTLLIVVLLIAFPLGYLVASAQASRDSGEEKQRLAASKGMVHEWPSKVQRRIYDVPIPPKVEEVSYFETNAWDTSAFFVQFRTTAEDLDSFLQWVDTDRSALRPDTVTITDEQAEVVGWTFDEDDGRYWGTTHRKPDRALETAITVDLSNVQEPLVYVVSTTEF